jgi:hypothetical protein
LRIYPDELTHQQVTELLGVQPTEAYNVGDHVPLSGRRVRLTRRTVWLLSSEVTVSSKDTRAHLDWLLDQVAQAQQSLFDLQFHHEVKMSVCCVWWSAGGGGPTLWPEQMKRLAELNLECSFDIYFFPQDSTATSPER